MASAYSSSPISQHSLPLTLGIASSIPPGPLPSPISYCWASFFIPQLLTSYLHYLPCAIFMYLPDLHSTGLSEASYHDLQSSLRPLEDCPSVLQAITSDQQRLSLLSIGRDTFIYTFNRHFIGHRTIAHHTERGGLTGHVCGRSALKHFACF